METLMTLKEIGGLRTSTFKNRDGQDQVIESFDVILTNGLDTIQAETGKIVTAQFKMNPPVPGHIYACNIRLQVIEYERDGKKSNFFKATLSECKDL